MLGLKDYDTKNMKARCCFHKEDTASLIYNPKNHTFHCFGCSRTVDIIDVLMLSGKTYMQAVQELFRLADIKYPFGELGVKTNQQYHYPKEVVCTNKDKVYAYLGRRKISKETIDATDVREDDSGNIVYNF